MGVVQNHVYHSFPLSYSADIDEYAVMYGNFMNAFEMLKCSEEHPVLELPMHDNTKIVAIARWSTKYNFTCKNISTNFDIFVYYHMLNPIIDYGW